MTNINMIETNNHYRVICETSMPYVCVGHTYKVTAKNTTAIFVVRDECDIARMNAWIAYYSSI